MSIFDLIFIGCFLATVFYSGWIVWLLIRLRWAGVRYHAIRLGTAIGVYLLILILAGVSLPRHVSAADEILRYDDWCLGVEKSAFAESIKPNTKASPNHRFLIVTLKVISEAGRVRQAAPKGALVYLLDENDARYDVSERGQTAFESTNGAQPELTTKLDPHSSFLTTRVFEVSGNAKEFFLAHRHGTGFPGSLIIGQGFRKPPVIHLRPQTS